MFIEKIIEFELRGPGLSGHACNAKTGYVHGQTTIPKETKSSSELLLTAKYIAGGNLPCFLSLGQSQIQILSKKCYV